MSWLTDIVVDGRDAVLVLTPIDWRLRPKIAHLFAVEESEGGTGVEARAPDAPNILLTITVMFTVEKAAAKEMLDALLALRDERLALPLWPDERTPADYAAALRVYSAQHYVNLDPATGAHVVDGSGGHASTVGLLIGRLASEPSIVATTDWDATIELQVEEDSPWASRIEPNTLAVAGWEWEADWRNAPRITRHNAHERQRIGRGREAAFLRPESPNKREDRATFVLQGLATIRKFLTFWAGKRGPHASFDVPSWFHPGYDEATDARRRVRFIDEVLTFEFTSPDEVRVSAGFREELVLDGGEPSQELPGRAYLIKMYWAGSENYQAWTDWAQPLTHSAINYAPGIAEVKRTSETLRPGETEWELLVYDYAGNPLRAFALLAIERRLKIEIRECDPTNAAAAVLVFAGEVKSAPRKGQLYRAKCALFGGVLRHLVPNYFCQTSCNHTLYDDLCGVDAEAHKVIAAIAVRAGVEVDVSGGAAEDADYFAFGYAVFGAGDTQEVRFIVRSVAASGNTRLTIHRPLLYNNVGAAVEFFPGCDGQFEGGCVKFANQEEFGGDPYKPDYIDSVDTGFKAKTGK